MMMPSDVNLDDFDASGDDIKLVNEKALTWFDVSCIGTGEMLFTAGFAWIVYIASLYGIKWTIFGFVGGALVIHCAWWLYREMITAVPEPGSIQSYAREANMFSLGTSYFVGYAPVYGAFMWLELQVADGLFHALFPTVANWIWPYVIIGPVVILNLMGNQVTGKVQTILVILTLIGDGVAAICVWYLIANHQSWAANWASPSPINWLSPFTVIGLWLGIMAAVLEVQQILVDEWSDFPRSRDIGLLSAAWQLWMRQIPLAFAVLAGMPLVALSGMAVPTVELIHDKLGNGPLFYLALSSMLIATYTTFSVYFMAEGKVLALYSQQGALPRAVGQYSSRAVPWIAILMLAGFALIGAYFTNTSFIITMLSNWSASLYFVIPLFFLGMRARKNLDRPLKVKFGVPIAIFLLCFTGIIAYAIFISDWQAGLAWYAAVGAFVVYDAFIVPRTKRGSHYRAQVLRQRTSAARL
jgi:L-asparagine transporter-like permease